MQTVNFTEETHTYTDETNKVYGSVTQILQDMGAVDYSMVKDEVLQAGADFGDAVHKTCALYDMGELDSCDPQVEPYLDGWKKFVRELAPQFLAIELPMISKTWGFAGTPDRVYKLTGNNILDIKTGVPIPATDLQTAGYQILVEENMKYKIRGRFTVKLMSGDYRLIPHKDPQDIVTFKGMVNTWHWLKKNGLIRRQS